MISFFLLLFLTFCPRYIPTRKYFLASQDNITKLYCFKPSDIHYIVFFGLTLIFFALILPDKREFVKVLG